MTADTNMSIERAPRTSAPLPTKEPAGVGPSQGAARPASGIPHGTARVGLVTGEPLGVDEHPPLPSRAEIVAQVLVGCALVLSLALAVVLR